MGEPFFCLIIIKIKSSLIFQLKYRSCSEIEFESFSSPLGYPEKSTHGRFRVMKEYPGGNQDRPEASVPRLPQYPYGAVWALTDADNEDMCLKYFMGEDILQV